MCHWQITHIAGKIFRHLRYNQHAAERAGHSDSNRRHAHRDVKNVVYDIPSHSVIRFCRSAVWLLCEYILLILQYKTIGHNLHWYITWWSLNHKAFTVGQYGGAKKTDQRGYIYLHCNTLTISKQFIYSREITLRKLGERADTPASFIKTYPVQQVKQQNAQKPCPDIQVPR
jgi:hypothetical protein